MIYFPCTHLFDAMCPQLEDHEIDIWYQHPLYDLSCNTLGIIDFGDSLAWTSSPENIWIRPIDGKERHSLGSREKIVMECYTATLLPNHQFFHIDNNPYNLTQENLVYFNYRSRDPGLRYYNKKLRDFLAKTVDYMNSRSAILINRGVKPQIYWEAMSLPSRVMSLWRKVNCGSGKKPVKNPRGYYKPNSASIKILEEVKAFKDQGYTQKAISKATNINVGMVRYYLKKLETCYDI